MVKSRATHELPKLEENHTTFWICPVSCKLVQMANMKQILLIEEKLPSMIHKENDFEYCSQFRNISKHIILRN
ncbi:hypothetical protein C0J52_00334 [Blattella germanica]|nr:hypothetical protein C0J52_00334 [Blattella germanica]